MAVAEASFSTSMLSMSLGLSDASGFDGTEAVARPPLQEVLEQIPGDDASGSFSMGKPSITYSGSLLPVMEEVPRTRMVMPPPGVLDAVVTCTPAAAPCSTWSSEATGERCRAAV